MGEPENLYPDLALLRHPKRRAIVCLVCDRPSLGGGEHVPDALRPFHRYTNGETAAWLFDDAGDAAWLEEAEALLARHGLHAGLSGPFELAASARGCMTKAALALATGRRTEPDKCLYRMDDYREEALLQAASDALAAQGFVSSDFYDAVLDELSRVDAQEHAQYGESLETYLNCGLNLRQAAQRLGVHRNTLAYRMQRVQERFGLDLSDMNACFELLFGFWLRRHLPPPSLPNTVRAFDEKEIESALWQIVERVGGVREIKAGMQIRLLCIDVCQLADEQRAQLVLAVHRQCGTCAFDDDTILVVSDEEKADALFSRILSEAAGCGAVVTQGFDAARLRQRVQLGLFALRADALHKTGTRDSGSMLFFMALERKMSLSPYLCEEVIRVMDEDATRGTGLSQVLYAYLLSFMDMKRAAQQIGMHRNTLEYQLRKILALMEKPLDGQLRFAMMCTYKMLALPPEDATVL